MKYHCLFVIFEKAAKFEVVVCFKLKVAFYGLILVFVFVRLDNKSGCSDGIPEIVF